MLQFQTVGDLAFQGLMASSDVDQKFLGRYARGTHDTHPLLSAALFRVLGLSVILSKKLIRARRLRRLDTTRDTKSLQLYHQIIWLSREGLTILEEYAFPLIANYPWELQILAHKLRASFYHIFVLFHNQPSVHRSAAMASAPPLPRTDGSTPAHNEANNNTNGHSSNIHPLADQHGSMRKSPPDMLKPKVKAAMGNSGLLPPGLQPISFPRPAATFLLPARNYIPDASAYFSYAADMANKYLFGSHPIRLSVKTEYAAYLYDCLHDGEASRKLARSAIRDVYNAPEGMDDDMFEDAADMVSILGKMMTRGLRSSDSTEGSQAPRNESNSVAPVEDHDRLYIRNTYKKEAKAGKKG